MINEMMKSMQDATLSARAGANMIEHSKARDVDWDAVLIELQASVKYAKRAKILAKQIFQ